MTQKTVGIAVGHVLAENADGSTENQIGLTLIGGDIVSMSATVAKNLVSQLLMVIDSVEKLNEDDK